MSFEFLGRFDKLSGVVATPGSDPCPAYFAAARAASTITLATDSGSDTIGT